MDEVGKKQIDLRLTTFIIELVSSSKISIKYSRTRKITHGAFVYTKIDRMSFLVDLDPQTVQIFFVHTNGKRFVRIDRIVFEGKDVANDVSDTSTRPETIQLFSTQRQFTFQTPSRIIVNYTGHLFVIRTATARTT